MSWKGTYDGTIHYNPVDKFTIIIVKTSDQNVPREARQERRYPDHLIRFTAIGYELPRTDAVGLEIDGEWVDGKHGFQLQVEHWKEIIPRSEEGVKGYLSSGLIKGIGPKLADDLVMRFGVNVLDILEKQPDRLLEIKGITENKLEEIKISYAESRMLRDLMTLLSPFKVTPKTALKIYQELGPTSVEMLKKSPFELCGISGFGFLRVDALVRKTDNRLHDPIRIKGAVLCSLNSSRSEKGHLFLEKEVLQREALNLLNKTIPFPDQRLCMQEVAEVVEKLVLNGTVVLVKAKMCKQERDLRTGRLIQKIVMEDIIYRPNVFEQEDETARQIALHLTERQPQEQINSLLEKLKVQFNLMLSEKQEMGVKQAFQSSLSIITGPPGTGKTTVIKMIIELFRVLYPKSGIMLMAPTGRASRRMAESTGFEEARTMHNALRLSSEEAESHHSSMDCSAGGTGTRINEWGDDYHNPDCGASGHGCNRRQFLCSHSRKSVLYAGIWNCGCCHNSCGTEHRSRTAGVGAKIFPSDCNVGNGCHVSDRSGHVFCRAVYAVTFDTGATDSGIGSTGAED